MPTANHEIKAADIMNEGLFITFRDGRCAIYSAELLLSVFSQAKEITPDEDDHAPL